jgi:hypothetical protein
MPSGLERFYAQQISWEPCESYATTSIESAIYDRTATAECGHLEAIELFCAEVISEL